MQRSLDWGAGSGEPPRPSSPFLTFFDPEELAGARQPHWVDPRAAKPHRLVGADWDERLEWTLDEFFERWILPGVLKPGKRKQGTIDLYGDALRYWRHITGGPPFHAISDELCIDFVGLLPEWGFTRRGIHRGQRCLIGRRDEHPSYEPLSSSTIAAHVSKIATMLRLAGPQLNPRERTAGILPRCPFIPLVAAEFELKPPFALDQARRIAANCGQLGRPDLPAWITHEQWWQTRIGFFYYTGLRAGTVCRLKCRHIQERREMLWLKIPGEEVTKTSKAVEMPLHWQLAERVRPLCVGRDPDDLLLPEGCGYRHFMTLHSELQHVASVPDGDRQSPHAWRRTHLAQMAQLGADDGRKVAQIAADHADGRTTEKNYIGQTLVNQLRLQLPPLWLDTKAA